MHIKRTVTTREQVNFNGIVRERTATHIAVDAHGYVTLCTSGHNIKRDDINEIIADFVILNENQFPVTYKTCFILWHAVSSFNISDFMPEEERSDFKDTELIKVKL
ncbi:hypothetical protein KXZ58_24250 [Klebsiella pneumoniae]|uniref:hypothetical protein n=1 Tax=Klebsiella pneumoniae TaxID=573 RepID=UPI001CA39592|nr:hypothetical protein [Klebsiella pneumoniae]MBY8360040.1 hypothetical protein [Klebsiella pneumoniae]